ncbi:MAG: META domain-containing protein [Treponema sp.]|nr:META domain-containing protein [Treponema sp.]
MKKYIYSSLLIFAFFLLFACAGGPKFSDVSGKEWKLVEVKKQPESIKFDRNTLVSEGFANIFTLNFDAERLSGIGAPNRYSTPYELGKKQAITVKEVASTLMAPLREPEKLKENEFFACLRNIYMWNINSGGQLELLSKGDDGREVTLIFEL